MTLLVPEMAESRQHVLATACNFELARRDLATAFSYAVSIEDYSKCTEIVLHSGLRLLGDSSRVLQKSLPLIPKTQLVRYPVLSLCLALMYCSEKNTRIKGLEHFALTLTATRLTEKTRRPQERLAINVTQTMALRLTGQFTLAASSARSHIKSFHELPLADRDQLHVFETLAMGQWAVTLLFVGDFHAAPHALQHAIAAGSKIQSRAAKYHAISLLALRYAVDGDLAAAATHAQTAEALFVDTAVMELDQQTPLAMAQALIELGRLNPDAAEAHLHRVFSETATSEFWGGLRIIEAKISLLRGSAGMASGRLEMILKNKQDLPALNPLDVEALQSVQSHLLLVRGKISSAAAMPGKATARNSAGDVFRGARIHLALGEAAKVVERLGPGPQFGTIVEEAEAKTLLTIAELHLRPWDAVRPELESLAGVLTALDNMWPLAMLSAESLELLSKATPSCKCRSLLSASLWRP